MANTNKLDVCEWLTIMIDVDQKKKGGNTLVQNMQECQHKKIVKKKQNEQQWRDQDRHNRFIQC